MTEQPDATTQSHSSPFVVKGHVFTCTHGHEQYEAIRDLFRGESVNANQFKGVGRPNPVDGEPILCNICGNPIEGIL